MEIDPGLQQAAVANLESQRASRQADLQYARQQADAHEDAARGGRGQRRGARAGRRPRSPPAEAQLKAADAQIREQRVALGYHRVTAPTAGVVGDIPVRVGDSVTRSTVLTTIDQNAGLEVYINVPVQEAPNLRVGLPVQLVDDARQAVVPRETIAFVAPSVDAATQSVLAKAVARRRRASSAPSSSCARGSSGRRRRP